jgi:competence protein comEA helix-hairpin-helix repeat region
MISREEEARVRENGREWAFAGCAAALLVSVGLAAALSAPDLTPVQRVEYSETADMSGGAAPASSDSASGETLIDLNTAGKEALMRLDGLGDKTAEKILAYRLSHGRFDSVDELLNIEGIGEKKLEAWRPYLTVGKPEG